MIGYTNISDRGTSGKMKVLIVNTSEKRGGAAVAANRLLKALCRNGIEARMLVRDKVTSDSRVVSTDTSFVAKQMNRFRFLWERLVIFVHCRFRRKNLFRISIANTGKEIHNHPLVREADIIHIHWINQGFLSLSDLEKLKGLKKPVVVTMHDMWSCTAICHHAQACDHYKESCGNCHYLASPGTNDLSARVFVRKKRLFEGAGWTFVGCSRWLSNLAAQSALTGSSFVTDIPNPIDTTLFRRKKREEARKRLGLPDNKYLLLFGAVNVTDELKGVSFLIGALKLIGKELPDLFEKLELVVFGQVKSENRDLFSLPVHAMGFLSDEEELADLYSSCDLFVSSSREENLPNTIMEAMACGTPCVGFDRGGIPEMIDHLHNGYVSEYQSIEDLAAGILNVLDPANREIYGLNARSKVCNAYDQDLIAGRYITLYRHINERE